MEIPDLPQDAFEHCGDGKIKPQGGGGGGIVSAITDPISDVLGTSGGGGGILGAVEDVGQAIGDVGVSIDQAVTQPIGNALAEVDTFVNREIPGGWVTVGLTAAGAAAYTAAANSAVAAGATTAEAAAAGSAAAQAAEAAALLDAAALAEGGVTAGMAAAANTGIPAGTSLLGGGAGFVGLDAGTAAELGLVGESGLGTAGASGDVLAGLPTVSEGAPIFDYSTEATLTPGGNVVPATTLPSEMAAIDAQIATAGAEAAKALPMKISPMQAIQGARLATGLLGGGQQQAQALPQMGGAMNRMPQGAVDYSGIYNLLALQRARNPNSLLG
jgi:hypothetical protein